MSLLDFDQQKDIYAVMGNPISHSKSPFIHQMFARQTGQKMEYSAIQVDPGGFEQAVGNFQANGGKGLNITVPFKQEAWRLVSELSERAQLAGAVNTISIEPDGTLKGDNTDGVGLVHDLTRNQGLVLAGKTILVLGAGGAVRGVLGPLLDQNPARLVLTNRTVEKAHDLAELFHEQGNIEACGFNAVPARHYDLIINGTSASLNDSVPPIPPATIAADTFCYDMMYGNQATVFMRWCHEHGSLKQSDGLGMLVGQAAESFFIWRGIRPEMGPVIDAIRQQAS